ncbi:MAG TPA: 7-cyano-7-deazaguanine synthase QueC [Dissulfurispiraceae bacterium]|nr:7-cyano-7-deazaguanine synthase QueC [Dissulfurispiraceae bacterium]
MKAVVLLSGGIDSTTVMAMVRAQGYSVFALSFSYGQRHSIELEAARQIAQHLGAARHLITDFNLREIGGSALTSHIEVPKGARPGQEKDESAGDEKQSPAIPVTYVPARNTIFLSFALGWAEVLEASDIFIGANAIDYSGYPDCRPEYLAAFETMANLATRAGVEGTLRFRINAPLLAMTKADIIRTGVSHGLDYGLTWSCYDPQEISPVGTLEADRTPRLPIRNIPDRFRPCGRCDSCLFRAKGFAEAGIADPALR